MALRKQLEKLKIGHPLVVLATDMRGHTHDLKATFQGLTNKRVKVRLLAGKVDSCVSPKKIIIKHPMNCTCDSCFNKYQAELADCT